MLPLSLLFVLLYVTSTVYCFSSSPPLFRQRSHGKAFFRRRPACSLSPPRFKTSPSSKLLSMTDSAETAVYDVADDHSNSNAAVAAPSTSTTPLFASSQENIELSAQVIGGVLGYCVGGPWCSALASRFLKRQSKSQVPSELGKIVTNVSLSSISSLNYLNALDTKYSFSSNLLASLHSNYNEFKYSGMVPLPKLLQLESTLLSLSSSRLAEDCSSLYSFSEKVSAAAESAALSLIEEAAAAAEEFKIKEKGEAAAIWVGVRVLEALEGAK